MDYSDFWVNFWTTNSITSKKNPHSKVGRTINGIPISKAEWIKVLSFIKHHLELCPQDNLLDFCAGSGMLTIPFSKAVKKITALDISLDLLSNIPKQENIEIINADARKIYFQPGSFSKIVFYFSIQHFSYEDVISLFEKFKIWLQKDGILYIGDIPDIDKTFIYFNTKDYKQKYFESLKNKTPIVGTWFKKDFLLELSDYTGFARREIITQPNYLFNAWYRFDMKLIK